MTRAAQLIKTAGKSDSNLYPKEEIMMHLKCLAVTAGLLFATSVLAQQPIKIGFMAELSGPQGALGQDQYDAFMLVVEQNGGKLGGVPVQVLREDSQLKPEVADADRRQADREGQGADHHRHHVLQRHDGGAQEDHRQGGVPDRLERRPVADRRRAVLAVSRSSRPGRTTTRRRSSASTRPTRATSGSSPWRRTTRRARTSSPASSATTRAR